MSQRRFYGVICKAGCGTALVLGDKMSLAPDSQGGDPFNWPPTIKPFRFTHCSNQEFEYTQHDLREFPYLPNFIST